MTQYADSAPIRLGHVQLQVITERLSLSHPPMSLLTKSAYTSLQTELTHPPLEV